ncbi:MAG TPA: hypothetical protein VNN22_06625 [Verrucomicrobiae bacterium]|nr:hypothetical protein [Verrucomicrobiae bacterium]
MVSRSFVLGYHGCDATVTRKVVSGDDQLLSSDNKHDWLGNGQYFWEDSYSRAIRWAKEEETKKSGKVKKASVLGAIIDLGNCLNLIDTEHLGLVKAAHAAYLEICQATGDAPAQNKGKDLSGRYLDCAVFETLHQLRKQDGKPAFDTVRAFFVEGHQLYATAGLRSLDHIQICVRNPRSIIGYFLPRET